MMGREIIALRYIMIFTGKGALLMTDIALLGRRHNTMAGPAGPAIITTS
ncbi:hypothetical protein CKO_01826 [Citrobacter koseri ATCC BAA-895]|uniref:Uncharacterized protein n=1 Tax=Citrobacter koseri (strain ATCC BAA-895 / CDC 4225-83 / SGSC4696) TaxID=290338 RepID=A8AHJ1_CITK8|nr:hypothetical protein CKO_01826 [Citrobacter koseri ATCC BAA-895]